MVFFFFAATFSEKSGTVKRGVHAQAERVKRMVVPPGHVRLYFFQPDAPHSGYGIGKIPIHHILTDSQISKICAD